MLGDVSQRMAATAVQKNNPDNRIIVAKHMCHAKNTAEQYFVVNDRIENAEKH